MPFNELQRRDSWPPTIVLVRVDEDDFPDPIANAIDENPFAYFLTAPEDIDDDIEDLSAGIESLDAPKPRVRTVSPSSLQRVPIDDDEEDDDTFGLAMPLSLRDFTRAHSKKRKEEAQRGSREEMARGRLTVKPLRTPRRGRATVRLTSSRSGRGRGQTRSLSARRPQSWREPSPDIWSIEEERESGSDEGDDRTRQEGDERKTGSTKVSPNAEAVPQDIPLPKPKKRVHWAF